MSLRRLVLPALLWAATACRTSIPVPYPPTVESDFRPRCAAEYGRLGATTASPEVAEARCDCVLRLCEAEWGFTKFTKIIRNIDTGRYRYRYVTSPWGYAPVEIPTTFPTAMLDMMEQCRLTIADDAP